MYVIILILTLLVLLDFSKAFDTVRWDQLCNKLKRIGLTKNAVKFIGSYLFDRLALTSRVPQGSILGQLLFSIFINARCVRMLIPHVC